MSRLIKRIPLKIENIGGVSRKAWPITQGVPFADGELPPGAPVWVVDTDGRILPTQSSTLATWDKDMKYVKWLLVDFQCDLDANETREVFLEHGEGGEPSQPDQAITVAQHGSRIKIDTGAMQLEIRKDSSDFFAVCQIKSGSEWRDVLKDGQNPYLYMISTDGEIFGSHVKAPVPKIEIEDEGPMRVSVAIKGYHAKADGLCICPYTLRIHTYAGRSDLRFFHTFVFDQDPDLLEFSQVGMKFPLDLGDDLRMSFGGQENAHYEKGCKQAQFLQSSDIAYQATFNGEITGEGKKTRGWANLCADGASVFIAVRDFWQQYPKGYELTEDGIDLQLWPGSYNQPLIFFTPWKERAARFDGYYGGLVARAESRDEATVKRILEENPTAPLNLKSFGPSTIDDVLWIEEMIEKYAPDRLASHNDTGTQDGAGAAKTHEFLVHLSAKPISDEDAEEMAICLQEPVIAPADPAYIGKTRAARDVYGGSDPRFAEIDPLLDGIVERVAIEAMHIGRRWGFWRFGNMCCSHAAGPGLSYIAHYGTDPMKGLRYVGPYNNEADDPCWGVWTQFLRTGRRDFFITASGFSRAMGDVGICHAHPTNPGIVGLMHYHNGHQWSGGHSPSHTLNTTHFLHYYLTGDRRMKEIGIEAADWGVRNQEKAGIIKNRGGQLNREFTGPLVCVMEAYVATWEAKYGDLARRSLNWFLRTQEKPGIWATSVYTRGDRGDEAVIQGRYAPLNHGGIMYPIFHEALRYFDNSLLRETIIAEADLAIAHTAMSHTATNCVLAYQMTNDPIYAAFCKHCIESYRGTAEKLVNMDPEVGGSFFSGIRNGYIAILKSAVAKALDTNPDGFAEAEERLRDLMRKGTENSKPQSEFAEKSIGVIEGYD